MKLTVITQIYAPNEETQLMLDSAQRFHEVVNTWDGKRYIGNGHVILTNTQAVKELDTDIVCYSDGGDTLFLKELNPPKEVLVYSAEKACWPLPQLQILYPESPSYWRYLNAGNWVGPKQLVIEFFERYVHPQITRMDIDGQSQQTTAFLRAKQDGFPIMLDYNCALFQSMAFEHESDFTYTETTVKNNYTGHEPAVLHYNGRTDMTKGIRIYKNQLNDEKYQRI